LEELAEGFADKGPEALVQFFEHAGIPEAMRE
jgi:hypothetical protein